MSHIWKKTSLNVYILAEIIMGSNSLSPAEFAYMILCLNWDRKVSFYLFISFQIQERESFKSQPIPLLR